MCILFFLQLKSGFSFDCTLKKNTCSQGILSSDYSLKKKKKNQKIIRPFFAYFSEMSLILER